MRVDDLRSLPLFGDLADGQIAQLVAAGTVVPKGTRVAPGAAYLGVPAVPAHEEALR